MNDAGTTCIAADRRLLLRRDPLRDRVVSAAALHLQLHGLPDCLGKRLALNMPVLTESFRIVQGSPKGWRRPSPLGADVTSWFCADCGGRIYGERKGRPETINIRAGTLDDTTWMTPVAHIFLRSAQRWVQPASGAECHDLGPSDFRPLAAKWRALWPEFFAARA